MMDKKRKSQKGERRVSIDLTPVGDGDASPTKDVSSKGKLLTPTSLPLPRRSLAAEFPSVFEGRSAKRASAVFTDTETGGKDAIKVCVRVRPMNEMEMATNEPLCVRVPNEQPVPKTVILALPSSMHADKESEKVRTFACDRVYWSAKPKDPHFCTQETLMEDLGYELRNNAFDGYNACLMAYGQTGSGKTYSVLGNETPEESRGLLPRIIKDIFETIADLKELTDNPLGSSQFATSVSYIEIYNDCIRDLLASETEKQQKLEVRTHPKVGQFVSGLKDVPVFDWDEVAEWLEFGVKARAVASTMMNATSSRSHCIFTLEISRTMKRASGTTQLRSKVHMVDLAGSERQRKTQATGDRLREGAMINQSLSALALVISRLGEASKRAKDKLGQEHIPFRSSKLTYLLMDSLSGNSKTVMIAAVSPAAFNYEETLSTLTFAQSVKAVKTSAKKNESNENALRAELEAECERLRVMLEEGLGGHGHAAELAAMEELVAKYGRDFESQLQLAKELTMKRKALMMDNGLSSTEMSESVGLSPTTPHLLNVCYDPELDGCLIYFLQMGVKSTIGHEKSNTILISGLGVKDQMAEIENIEDRRLTLRYLNGRVLLNGRQAEDIADLMHNDRIIFGHAFCFRLFIPLEQHQGEHGTSRKMSIEDASEEIQLENDRAYQQCLWCTREIEGRIGETRAQAFRQQFHRVCRMVEEANEIAKTVSPQERLHFSAEVLTDLFGSDFEVPECIVRLKRLPTGKLRWRYIVKTQIINKKSRFLQNLSSLRAVSFLEDFDQTVLLLNFDEFKHRMQYYREVCKVVHTDGLGALADMPSEAKDCWDGIPPWTAQQLAQEHLIRELQVKAESYQAKSDRELELEVELESLRKMVQTKDNRIKALEAARGSRHTGFYEERKSNEVAANENKVNSAKDISAWTSGRAAAHDRVMSQVSNMLESSRRQQVNETEALDRQMVRLEDCSNLYFQKLRDLRREVQEELEQQPGSLAEVMLRTDSLAAELQASHQELAEHRNGSRGALELAEYYVQQRCLREEMSQNSSPNSRVSLPERHTSPTRIPAVLSLGQQHLFQGSRTDYTRMAFQSMQ